MWDSTNDAANLFALRGDVAGTIFPRHFQNTKATLNPFNQKSIQSHWKLSASDYIMIPN